MSHDLCTLMMLAGSLGTAGRECNRTSLAPDGCDIMCCGRGYDTRTVTRTQQCDCKFQWCCRVKCKECDEVVDIHTCKGPNPTVPPPSNYNMPARRTFTWPRQVALHKVVQIKTSVDTKLECWAITKRYLEKVNLLCESFIKNRLDDICDESPEIYPSILCSCLCSVSMSLRSCGCTVSISYQLLNNLFTNI